MTQTPHSGRKSSVGLSGVARPVRKLLVGAYYVAQPVLKPTLKATVGRNERVWQKLQSARDGLITGSTLPAGINEPWPRRVYASLFFVVGAPARFILKNTLGRNAGLWRRVRRVHGRLIAGPAPAAWTRDPAEPLVPDRLSKQPFGVNLAGYLTSEKGTGEAARSAAAILKAAGLPLALNNIIDSGSANREAAVQGFTEVNPYAFNIIYVNGDQAANFAFHKGRPYFQDRYSIGAWNWELTSFPDEWTSRFQYFDEIWVPTTFVRDALARISPIPVTKVPYAVQAASSAGRTRSHFDLPADDFIFLFMFDFHSAFERKNPLGLIEAFKRSFSTNEAATLFIKSSRADKRSVMMMCEAAVDAKIMITDTVLSREEINALYRLCDCYVSLHRSEGFGLTPAEAMAAGKPVIATAYGGNMDFMTAENSYLVRYVLTELKRDYTPYQKGWVWADPDINHAAELMRHVYEDRSHGRAVGRRAAGDIRRLLGPEAVGEAMKQQLEAIASEIGIAIPEVNPAGEYNVSLRRREAT